MVGKRSVRTIAASEANRRFSEILRDAKSGAFITVTSRGRPVAMLGPVGETGDSAAAEQAGKVRAFMENLKARPLLGEGKLSRDDMYD